MPILKPVKLPGPEAQANRSTSASLAPASSRQSFMSFNRVADCETFGSPIRVASSTVPYPSQTLPPMVAVSKLNTSGDVIWLDCKVSVLTLHSARQTGVDRFAKGNLPFDKAAGVSC